MTICDNNFKEQTSELAVQHLKDDRQARNDSPFAITTRSMIENMQLISHGYSSSQRFELIMERVINQVNSGEVGNVRRLELELMQAGKV